MKRKYEFTIFKPAKRSRSDRDETNDFYESAGMSVVTPLWQHIKLAKENYLTAHPAIQIPLGIAGSPRVPIVSGVPISGVPIPSGTQVPPIQQIYNQYNEQLKADATITRTQRHQMAREMALAESEALEAKARAERAFLRSRQRVDEEVKRESQQFEESMASEYSSLQSQYEQAYPRPSDPATLGKWRMTRTHYVETTRTLKPELMESYVKQRVGESAPTKFLSPIKGETFVTTAVTKKDQDFFGSAIEYAKNIFSPLKKEKDPNISILTSPNQTPVKEETKKKGSKKAKNPRGFAY